MCTALDRLNAEYDSFFFRQLDEAALKQVADQGSDLVIFTDLGSGMIKEICELGILAVVADHHKPARTDARPMAHINPHLVGADGANQLSGSGSAFLLARALASSPGANDDLADLAVVGAVGDLQDMASGHLLGLNRQILEIGSKAGALSFPETSSSSAARPAPSSRCLNTPRTPTCQVSREMRTPASPF